MDLHWKLPYKSCKIYVDPDSISVDTKIFHGGLRCLRIFVHGIDSHDIA
jgi:hypothetical protein